MSSLTGLNVTPLQVAQAAEAARRADATEKKVAVLTAGFMKRATSLATQVSSRHSPPFHFIAVTDFQSFFQANGLADASYDKRVLLETYTQVFHTISFQLPKLIPALAVARSRAAGAAYPHAGASRATLGAAIERIRISGALFRT